MERSIYLWFLFGLVVIKIDAQVETDWKPIVGPSLPGLSVRGLPRQTISNRALNTGSGSRSSSSITFNGQTITTSIGDVQTNDAVDPVLTVDAPDLVSDIESNEPHYVGYKSGKILHGFATAAAPVSEFMWISNNCFVLRKWKPPTLIVRAVLIDMSMQTTHFSKNKWAIWLIAIKLLTFMPWQWKWNFQLKWLKRSLVLPISRDAQF